MATKKTSTTKTNKTNKEESMTTETKITEIYLTPMQSPYFAKTPGSQNHYISAEGEIIPEYVKETINENLKIFKYTNDPVINKNFQTFWLDADGNIIRICPKFTNVNAEQKITHPFKAFVMALFTQLGCQTKNNLDTITDCAEHLRIIKTKQTAYLFRVTHYSNGTKSYWPVFKPYTKPTQSELDSHI